MADPSSWTVLDDDFTTTANWTLQSVMGSPTLDHYSSPGAVRLYSDGPDEANYYVNTSLSDTESTVECRFGFYELSNRKYSMYCNHGVGQYSFNILFSNSGIYVENSSGLSLINNSDKLVKNNEVSNWRVIHYPAAGHLNLYKNGYAIGTKLTSDIVNSGERLGFKIGTWSVTDQADLLISYAKIANGAFTPVQIYDEPRQTDAIGTYMWDGLPQYLKTNDSVPEADLEKFVKFIGGQFDPEKSLIEDFVEDHMDMDSCQTKFLPFLGGNIGYEYNIFMDDDVNRAEIQKHTNAVQLAHTFDGINRTVKYFVYKNLLYNGWFDESGGMYTFKGWNEDSFGGSFTSTTGSLKGDYALQLNLSGGVSYGYYGEITSRYFVIDPDSNYEFYTYIKHEEPSNAGRMIVTIDFYDDNMRYLKYSTFTIMTQKTFTDEYKKYKYDIIKSLIPDTAFYAKVKLKFEAGSGVSTQFADAITLRKKSFDDYNAYETEPLANRFHGTESDDSKMVYYSGQDYLFEDADHYMKNNTLQNYHYKTEDTVEGNDRFDVHMWYQFEDATSSYVPRYAGNKDMYLYGNTYTSMRGDNFGRSLIFDGGYGMVSASAVFGLVQRGAVYQARVAVNTHGWLQDIFHVEYLTGAQTRFQFGINTNGYPYALYRGATSSCWVNADVTVTDNNFHDIDIVCDRAGDGYLSIYVDKLFAGSGSISGFETLQTYGTAYFGKDVEGGSNTFYGSIAEFRYGRAFSNTYSLSSWKPEDYPDSWTVNTTGVHCVYTETTRYKNNRSVQMYTTTNTKLMEQVSTDFTKSGFVGVNVDYYVGTGMSIYGMSSDGAVTYFSFTDTTSTTWKNFYTEFQATNTGFKLMLYGEGTNHFDNIVGADVTPRRRWGRSRFKGRKYAPCTVVIDTEAMYDDAEDKLWGHKVGGGKMIINSISKDKESVTLPCYKGYSLTTPHAFAKADFVGSTVFYGD